MKFPDTFVKKYNETENMIEIISGLENTFKLNTFCIHATNISFDIFTDLKGPVLFYNSSEAKETYKKARQRGVRIRVITEITKDNIFQCKECLGYIDELRHMDGITHMFGVSERHYVSSQLEYENPQITQCIFSNVKWFIKEQQYFFENLWKKAIPSKQRFREIELSLNREFIDTLRDPNEIVKLIPKIISSCTKELLCIIPSVHVFNRFKKEGLLDILTTHIEKYNLDCKLILNTNSILSTVNDDKYVSKDTIDRDAHILYPDNNSLKNTLPDGFNYTTRITKKDRLSILTLIVDKELMLSIEINQDTYEDMENLFNTCEVKDYFIIATYSNSPSTIYSYISVFEKLWIESS